MKNRIAAFLLAVITVFNIFPLYVLSSEIENSGDGGSETVNTESALPSVAENGYVEGKLSISCDIAYGSKIFLSRGQKEYVIANPADEIADGEKYRWQLKLPDGKWSIISGYVLPYAAISGALIANAMLDGGYAVLRCVVTHNDTKYVSNELHIALEESLAASVQQLSASGEDNESASELSPPADDVFQIAINYTFRHATQAPTLDIDGTPAANTFIVTFPTGGYYSGTVATPLEVGYLPYVRVEDAGYVTEGTSSSEVITYDGVQYVAANSIEFENTSTYVTVNVYYIPQEVDYLVKIYEQNIYDDEYTLVSTKSYTGIANSAVPAGLDTERVGFYSLSYDHDEEISEDGSYAIDIYYDRNYYAVNFDVDADVNGATPHSVRYGSQVMLPYPKLVGYAFKRWMLTEVTVENNVAVGSHSYPASEAEGALITVRHNLKYRAEWTVAETSYTVVYWLENADNPGKYDVWYTYKDYATTGTVAAIRGEDNVKNIITTGNGFTQNEVNDVRSTHPYLTYVAKLSDTEPQTLRGDGRTTVDIYYSRNEYTLKFYYAIEKPSGNKATYHIIGGSTYYFGGNASGNARTDEIAAMRQYASGSYQNQTGQVNALPTLNAKGAARGYTVGADTDSSNSYKYHYVSFTAKFGADITDLWPCDVFNSAQRTSANTHGNWSGRQAFVSAWNGENRVRYTQDSSINNGNQTIKGKYTHLDANLLWNDTSIRENTVSYACFWENGANINWSVPELYRYNIYLPLLPKQDTTGLTLRTYNGETYYLADQYNTCDDSSTSAQTRPGLVGFTSHGRDWAVIPASDPAFDTSLYKEAYDMFFYYSRNTYHLTFNDQHGNIVTLTVPYDTPIGDHSEEEHTPEYPSSLEAGECAFEGWYFDESCANRFDHDMRMPAKNIQVYANWKTLSYTVRVYFDKTEARELYSETVLFGSFVEEPGHKDLQTNDDVVFAGWYYMDGAVERRFDFNTMMVKQSMNIYAKWSSRILVPYTVEYVTYIVDANGVLQEIEIATPETGKALEGTTKTFTAQVGDKLKEGYQSGYFPEMRSHSMTISPEKDENTYKFVYTHTDTITYKVIHKFRNEDFDTILDVDGLNEIVETFTHTISGEDVAASAAFVIISFKEGIVQQVIASAAERQLGRSLSTDEKTNLWNAIKQMTPDFFEQKLTLTTESENEAIFEWSVDGNTATYQIIQYYEDLNGEYIPDYGNKLSAAGTLGAVVTAPIVLKNGYVENTDPSLPLRKVSGEITRLEINDDGTFSEGLVLRRYYTLERYTYTINHYKNVNNALVLESSSVHTAPHGTKIDYTDVAISIEGYMLSGGTSKVITEQDMEVDCYYRGLDVYYRYQVVGSSHGATLLPSTGDTVVGENPGSSQLTLFDGYFLKRWYYTVGDGEETAVPESWLSNDGLTVTPQSPPIEWVGKIIYIYAEVLPSTRRFKVEGAVSTGDPQAFMFHLQGKEGTATRNVNVTFILVGNDYLDVCELPYGDYTVTMFNWSWRYGTPTAIFGEQSYTATEKVFTLTLDAVGDVTFRYTEAPDTQWLTDEAAKYVTVTQSN